MVFRAGSSVLQGRLYVVLVMQAIASKVKTRTARTLSSTGCERVLSVRVSACSAIHALSGIGQAASSCSRAFTQTVSGC